MIKYKDMEHKVFPYLRRRVGEAGTWAGLGVVAAAGAAFYRELIILSVIFGMIAVLMPDYKAGDK
jgi:hypothetical protein